MVLKYVSDMFYEHVIALLYKYDIRVKSRKVDWMIVAYVLQKEWLYILIFLLTYLKLFVALLHKKDCTGKMRIGNNLTYICFIYWIFIVFHTKNMSFYF